MQVLVLLCYITAESGGDYPPSNEGGGTYPPVPPAPTPMMFTRLMSAVAVHNVQQQLEIFADEIAGEHQAWCDLANKIKTRD